MEDFGNINYQNFQDFSVETETCQRSVAEQYSTQQKTHSYLKAGLWISCFGEVRLAHVLFAGARVFSVADLLLEQRVVELGAVVDHGRKFAASAFRWTRSFDRFQVDIVDVIPAATKGLSA